MTQLVIGLGEVGSAIQKILSCDGLDSFKSIYPTLDLYDTIHICFPYSASFKEDVIAYREKFGATLVIVHSTVPLGTCDELGAVHSPIRGIHPNLEEGVRTFVKFFGGTRAHDAAAIFREQGIKTMACDTARETEALKLWDTTIYGWNILIEKAIKAYCERNELDFRTVYTLANATYNEGYALLGRPEYSKYVLKDYRGEIGGHCVKENWELLDDPIAEISKTLHKQITDS